jgi:hypothetical protein
MQEAINALMDKMLPVKGLSHLFLFKILVTALILT